VSSSRSWPAAPGLSYGRYCRALVSLDLAAMAAPESHKRDALLFYADGYKFPDVYHLTRFLAPDPIIALEQDGEVVIVANSLEEGRARKESRAREVFNIDEFGAKEFSKTATTREELDAKVIDRFLQARGLRRVAVGTYFPLGMAERLRGVGVELVIDREISDRRRAKRPDEIEALEAAQRATEDAWAKGVDALRRATVRKDGTLELDGETFTAERLRAVVELRLLELGCVSEGAIIAPGKQAADPHMIGSGPLRAGEAIVMDIFPQNKTTRYWADMTRTVSKGEPPAEIAKMYEITKRAQDAGIKALRPGVTGREVHELVEDIIFDAGYDTLRPGQQRSKNGGAPRRRRREELRCLSYRRGGTPCYPPRSRAGAEPGSGRASRSR